MQILKSIPVAILYCVAVIAAPVTPKLRLSEVQKIEPSSYKVDLTVDPEKVPFSGTIQIKLRVLRPARTIWLNANKISVEGAKLQAGNRTLTAKVSLAKSDFLSLQFDSPVPAGDAELEIHYRGEVRQTDSAGVFHTLDKGNHYILTQFEQTDARDAFPCFDEPSYKVPWQLTLHIPAADSAVSNTVITSDKSEGPQRTVVFSETTPLPSYLIAFAIGPFEYVDAGKAGSKQIPVRIVVPKGRAPEAKYAAEVTAPILTRLEEYFGIPFPYEKADQVAVPVTTGFGAMENAGMVTYGQTSLLSDPASDTLERQRSYAETAAHELAHQWFGDLVTTTWWDDIWLNEAFATWMEKKLIAEWKPEWNSRVGDVNDKLGAMDSDSLVSARQIRQPIETPGDINDAFDNITYQKGAAVIGMFESWIGADEFRAGVQRYLKRYAFKTTTAEDFLDSVSAGGPNLTQAFSTFLNQPGVPIVSVSIDCQSTPKLHLSQRRFLPVGSKGRSTQLWSIPVCLRYGTSHASEKECFLLDKAEADIALTKTTSCPAWIELNADAKGYYRMEYKGELLSSLTTGDVTERLSAIERLELIGNTQAVADNGTIPASDALKIAVRFHDDPERHVLAGSLAVALEVPEDLVPDNLMPNYERFLLRNFQARARELGWWPKPGESDDIRLLRSSIVHAVATFGGDQELAKEARELAEGWLKDHATVSADVLDSVLLTAAYYGDRSLFDRLFAEYQQTQNRQEQQALIGALLRFRDRSAIEAALDLVPSGKAPLPDGVPFLFNPGKVDRATRTMAFESLKKHYDAIMKKHANVFGTDLGSLLPSVGNGFCDPQSRKEYVDFFLPRLKANEGARRTYAQTLEGIDICIAVKKVQQPSVAAFLEKY